MTGMRAAADPDALHKILLPMLREDLIGLLRAVGAGLTPFEERRLAKNDAIAKMASALLDGE